MGKYDYGKDILVDIYFNKAVAYTLRTLRNKNNLSYSELSNKINKRVSRQILCRYELQESKLRIGTLKKIAKAYNISDKELFNMINKNYIEIFSKEYK